MIKPNMKRFVKCTTQFSPYGVTSHAELFNNKIFFFDKHCRSRTYLFIKHNLNPNFYQKQQNVDCLTESLSKAAYY